MMNQAVDEFDRAKVKMAGDLKTVIADSEDLLKAAAAVPGESFAAMRTKFEDKLKRARTTLVDASQPVLKKARQADAYVHGNPWTVIGVVAAVGLLVGFLATRRSGD